MRSSQISFREIQLSWTAWQALADSQARVYCSGVVGGNCFLVKRKIAMPIGFVHQATIITWSQLTHNVLTCSATSIPWGQPPLSLSPLCHLVKGIRARLETHLDLSAPRRHPQLASSWHLVWQQGFDGLSDQKCHGAGQDSGLHDLQRAVSHSLAEQGSLEIERAALEKSVASLQHQHANAMVSCHTVSTNPSPPPPPPPSFPFPQARSFGSPIHEILKVTVDDA